MSNTIFSFPTICQHHQDWQAEHATWYADNERWQAEHQAALETLKQIEQGLQDHREALNEHARCTLAHAEGIAADERAIDEYEQRGEHGTFHESLDCTHRVIADYHLIQRQAHERIERHHQHVIAQVAALNEAIEESL